MAIDPNWIKNKQKTLWYIQIMKYYWAIKKEWTTGTHENINLFGDLAQVVELGSIPAPPQKKKIKISKALYHEK